MGVDLGPIVHRREIQMTDLRGRTVVVDGHNALYQFLSSIRLPDGSLLTGPDGEVTSHLEGLLARTGRLVSAGIKPIYVFDGPPTMEKADTLRERRERKEKAFEAYMEALERGDIEAAQVKARQTSRLTVEMVEEARGLLRCLGVPYVDAPHEGEAQAAYMCARGDADAVASQDYDTLLFGAPVLVRNLTFSGRRRLPRQKRTVAVHPEICDLESTLNELGITREQLVDIAILVGTDFNTGIKGIGPKKGLKLIKERGSIDLALESVGAEIPNWERVREIFLNPSVRSEYSVEFGSVDEEAVISFLCEKHGFSESRVRNALVPYREFNEKVLSQRTLDAWF